MGEQPKKNPDRTACPKFKAGITSVQASLNCNNTSFLGRDRKSMENLTRMDSWSYWEYIL
jgi:hypothetical protein